MTIPPRLHFCWIGPDLPWAYVFAILSASRRSMLPEIVLHHTDALADDEKRHALIEAHAVRLSHTDAPALLREVGGALGLGDGLAVLYDTLSQPVARSDVLRAAILHAHGGIYLDLDTLTVASLVPLLAERNFVGCERIVWPIAARRTRSPAILARHLALDLLRKGLRAAPQGWRAFRYVERFYPSGLNNAVIGCEPGSPLIANYLRAMLALPAAEQSRRYGLGPHLLQDIAAKCPGQDLTVMAPNVFYPLPPEISAHWFRRVRRVRLETAISRQTRVVHWYASVRTRQHVASITPASIARDRDHQMYSALAFACLGDAAVRP